MSAFYTTVAKYYDAETGDKTDDLQMYSRLAERYGGPILDIGCGTGRVLLHLAQEGYAAHGIDDNRAMLARLEAKLSALPHLRDHIRIYEGDVLHVDPKERYALILLTYNALMHFHDQDQQLALLRRLRGWMANGGLLALDLPNAGETFASQDTDAITYERSFLDSETGHMVMLQSISQLDRTTQLLDVQWIYDEIGGDGIVRRMVVPHRLRYYFYPEVRLLLLLSGFEVQDVFGDTDEGPYEAGCERMIVYARPV